MMQDHSPLLLSSDQIVIAARQSLIGGDLWLSGLAKDLAAQEWHRLRHHINLTPETYSTSRVITGDLSIPKKIAIDLTAKLNPYLPYQTVIEHPFIGETHYHRLGLDFHRGDLPKDEIERAILSAYQLLMEVPAVAECVFHLIRSIHILHVSDDAYDVSHSDPNVPFSIFTTVPKDTSHQSTLRLTESILHETMHLQLSLLEAHAPIVATSNASFYSPWKQTQRPAQGVMHGLYVFSVIDAFFESLGNIETANQGFILNRRRQIRDEVTEIRPDKMREHLTDFGISLHKALLARFT